MNREYLAIEQLFHIISKTGEIVPFKRNNAQKFFDRHEQKRMIIVKARQCGFSSYILAKFAIRCLSQTGTRCVVISHETDATQRLLARVHFYLDTIRGPKPILGHSSKNEITFPKTFSSYFIGTAGARSFGRGDTITNLHCSEYAFWEDPIRLKASLFQAVPRNGCIIIESTGNGRNNDLYYTWKNADRMGFIRMFYPWYADPDYRLDVDSWKPDTPPHNEFLLDIQKRHRLSPEQMAWYESKLRELNEDVNLLLQEYPNTPDDSFQATQASLFPEIILSQSDLWQTRKIQSYECNLLTNHPQPNKSYSMGIDPAGGTGHDYSAIVIICNETGEQVFEFYNNRIDPIELAMFSGFLGFRYNKAFITCESNNHGISTISYLKNHYDRSRIYKQSRALSLNPKYGWTNTQQTKHALVGIIKESLDDVIIYGNETYNQLANFGETPEGKLMGDRDDLVIAFGLACLGFKRFYHLYAGPRHIGQRRDQSSTSYITYEDIMSSIKSKNQTSLFPKQVV